MTYKQMIIDDQKETIRRLQQECTEKTNAIIALGEHLKAKGQECEELKQILAEIKEIAENMNNECFYSDFDCKDCDMKNGCTYFNKKQILRKISEVEDD